MNNTLNVPLPIYKRDVSLTINLQQRYRNICSDKTPAFNHPSNRLPEFVFKRGFSPDVMTSLSYYNIATSTSTTITIGTQHNSTNSEGDIITAWNGQDATLDCGYYYYLITCGTELYYSDVWSATDQVDSLVLMEEDYCKITLQPTCLLGGIPFDTFTDFKIDTYLKVEPILPEYEIRTESSESNIGITSKESETIETSYLLVLAKAYQPLVDYLQHLGSYLVETGCIKILIPKDEVEHTITDIQVEDVIKLDECTPAVKLRVRFANVFQSSCEDEDLCSFKAPAPALNTGVGTNIIVTAGLEASTYVELFYRENSSGAYINLGSYYTVQEMLDGVTVDVGSSSSWQFLMRVYRHGCDLIQAPTTVISN